MLHKPIKHFHVELSIFSECLVQGPLSDWFKFFLTNQQHLSLLAPKKEITPREGPKKGFYVSCIILFEVTSALERCEEALAIVLYSVTIGVSGNLHSPLCLKLKPKLFIFN